MSVDASLALRATGLLEEFNRAGILTAADVHVARRLGVLAGEQDEQVLLAVALTVRGTRHGSVVLDLSTASTRISADADESEPVEAVALSWPGTDWVARCHASALLVRGPAVRMDGNQMWLDRYWRQEELVARELVQRSHDRPSVDPVVLRADLEALFPDERDKDQKRAAAVAALSRVSVLAGGPGTGKTTTIARLLAVLQRQDPSLRIALAAPTGKASARMEEAIRSATGLSPEDKQRLSALTASTLHRLLGSRPGVRSRFWHNSSNRLPYDVVVVDECSMVSLTLMARLVEALAPHTMLVLVGDPDQLASVEAGAVLGDLVDRTDAGPVTPGFASLLEQVVPGDVPPSSRPDAAGAALRESVVLLSVGRRFAGAPEIADLAELIRLAKADEVVALLRSGAGGISFAEVPEDSPFLPPAVSHDLLHHLVELELGILAAAFEDRVADALDGLDQHRLLCAHRLGGRGVRHWTALVEGGLAGRPESRQLRPDGYYVGQPLLVTRNDYENGLFNGDTGVVVQGKGKARAVFRRGGEPIEVDLVRLSDVRPLHAMTVHRAQGSQFAKVTVLLPLATSPLATRETLYTAVTRAATTVHVIGSVDAVLACIANPVARATGLRKRLEG